MLAQINAFGGLLNYVLCIYLHIYRADVNIYNTVRYISYYDIKIFDAAEFYDLNQIDKLDVC